VAHPWRPAVEPSILAGKRLDWPEWAVGKVEGVVRTLGARGIEARRGVASEFGRNRSSARARSSQLEEEERKRKERARCIERGCAEALGELGRRRRRVVLTPRSFGNDARRVAAVTCALTSGLTGRRHRSDRSG